MFINTTTLAEFSEQEIKALYPNTSFSKVFVPPEGYSVLFTTPKPDYNNITQSVVPSTPVLTDKGHWEQRWQVVELSAEQVQQNQNAENIRIREAAKAARSIAVNAITVTTTAGNTFDGDEVSQTRMARAILVMSNTNIPSIPWVLSDNTVIDATVAELTEALSLAGTEQSRLWVLS